MPNIVKQLLFISQFIIIILATQVKVIGDNSGNADSLEKLLHSAVDTQKVNLLNAIGLEYSQTDNILSLSYLNRALSLSRDINYLKGQADALTNIGTLKIAQGEYDASYKLLGSAYEIYLKLQYYSGAGRCLQTMAVVHSRLGNYDKAMLFYQSALVLFEAENDMEGVARVYNGMGIVCDQLKQYDRAIFFYEKALKAYHSVGNEIGRANTFINIAIVYNKLGRSRESIQLFTKSIEIGLKNNNLRLVSAGYTNIGVALLNEERYSESLEYQLKAISIKEQMGDQRGMMIGYINIADLYRSIDSTERALQFLDQALVIGKEQSAKPELKDLYVLLSEIYASKGLYEQAYRAHLNYSLYIDSIYGEEQNQKLSQAQQKFDVSQLESENTLLKQSNTIDKLTIEKTRYIKNFLVISLSFTVVFSLLLYYQYRQKRKTNASLVALNQQLRDVNSLLLKSEMHLKEVNASKDQFFSIISHDLRNPLASMVSFVRIMKRDMHNLSKEDMDGLVRELEIIVDRTGGLLENLLLWSRAQTGRIIIKPELLSLDELIDHNVALITSSAKNKQIKINVFSNKDCKYVLADYNITDTIIRNLIGNALKYTLREGSISIGSFLNGDKCVVYIKDTGVGIPLEKQNVLFKTGVSVSEDGTEKEKGSGLGLMLCREFVQIQGGEIWFESEVSKGTTFYFTLPSGA